MKTVASRKYWDRHWDEIEFGIVPQHHPVRKWIEEIVPNTTSNNCLEIGCYPGKFLAVFGDMGYKLNGVDFFHGTIDMSVWLSQRYKVGDFYESDFLKFHTTKQYDLVCSFGFVEHFKNWPEIIRKHIALVKHGGLVVIEVPNLNSPLYHFLYKYLEPEVLDNHVLEAMSLQGMSDVIKREECEILSEQYIGKFYFRFVTKHTKSSKLVAGFINLFSPILNLLPKSIHARYIGVAGIKQ